MVAMPLCAGTLASLHYCPDGLCSENRHRLFILPSWENVKQRSSAKCLGLFSFTVCAVVSNVVARNCTVCTPFCIFWSVLTAACFDPYVRPSSAARTHARARARTHTHTHTHTHTTVPTSEWYVCCK